MLNHSACLKYLVEHLLEILLGVDPRGNSIAEENEILHHSSGVHTDHVAHTPECRVLLLVVSNVAQGYAPAGGWGDFPPRGTARHFAVMTGRSHTGSGGWALRGMGREQREREREKKMVG